MILQAVVRSHRAVRELWAVGRVHVSEVEDGDGLQPGTELAAKGDLLGAAAVGELLRLEGELVVDPKWGKQFVIERQESLGIQHEDEAHRWLERLKGVGPTLAKRIHARFKGAVLELLREEPPHGAPDPLLDVDGVGPVLARTIRESWGQIGAQGDPETLQRLDALGLSRWEVNQVLSAAKRHGEEPKVFLERDPYRLIGEKGFGFARADGVALKAGVSRNAPARIDAAIVYQIDETCSEDTVAPMGKLIGDVVELTGAARDLVAEGVYRVARAARGVTLSEDAGGSLVHPTKLLEAERTIYRWATGARDVDPAQKPAFDFADHVKGAPALAPPSGNPEIAERAERHALACELAGIPNFVPAGGVCFACMRNVFEALDGTSPIGGCPHCRRSFCE